MDDQFIGNLTKGFRNVTVSRKRALQLIGGAIAVAAPARVPHVAEAGTHAKPLAVVAATVVDIAPSSGGTFLWSFQGAVVHTESGAQTRLQSSVGIVATVTTDQARTKIVKVLPERAETALENGLGLTVPRDRIAVTLL